MEIFSSSPDDTEELAQKIADKIKTGGIVCLYGDLGCGKTVFAQGLAKALGIKRTITSPTFLTMKSYGNFFHLDLYRIDQKESLKGLDLEEILSDKSNIVVIEWAEKIKNLLPKKRFDVSFEYINENTRRISVEERN